MSNLSKPGTARGATRIAAALLRSANCVRPALANVLLINFAVGSGLGLIWQAQFDKAGYNAVGHSETNTAIVGVIRAYKGKDGAFLWEDSCSPGNTNAVATRGKRVYTAGACPSTRAFSDRDFVVRAYSATDGELIWEDQVGGDGQNDKGQAIAVSNDRVFAAGSVYMTDANPDFVVRAYRARDGVLLWQDQHDEAGFHEAATAITTRGKRVFAVGFYGEQSQTGGLLVRAYKVNDGEVLWDARSQGRSVAAIVVEGKRVFVAGHSGSTTSEYDFLVRAHRAKDGALLWEDQYDGAGDWDSAHAIAAVGGRVFAAGITKRTTAGRFDFDFLVRAYDAKDGTLLWEDRYDKVGADDWARAIVVDRGQVFVAGSAGNRPGDEDFLVRVYRDADGVLLWEATYDKAGGVDRASAIAVGGKRVFGAGFADGTTTPFDRDFLVRAYPVDGS